MLKIDLDILIRDFAPAIIGENWKKFIGKTQREAAVFEYDVSCSNYDNDARFRKQLVIVVTNRNEVFWGVFDFTGRWVFEDLKFIGDHGSCWVDSIRSHLSELYFDMCKEIHPDEAPRNVHYFMTHGFGSDPIRKINIEVEIDRENSYLGYGYNKKLKTII